MYRRPELEVKWQNLSRTDYQVTSPKSQEYNCFAWAAEEMDIPKAAHLRKIRQSLKLQSKLRNKYSCGLLVIANDEIFNFLNIFSGSVYHP